MILFKWIFSGGDYHYVTTAPCYKCGLTTELTLSKEDYQLWINPDSFVLHRDEGYAHIICPLEAI